MEYTIVADVGTCIGGLVYCGMHTLERAQEVLEQTIEDAKTNPRFEGYTNFRIKEEQKKDCWWNDPFLAN